MSRLVGGLWTVKPFWWDLRQKWGHDLGHQRNGDPCYEVAKNLAEQRSCPHVLGKVELVRTLDVELKRILNKVSKEQPDSIWPLSLGWGNKWFTEDLVLQKGSKTHRSGKFLAGPYQREWESMLGKEQGCGHRTIWWRNGQLSQQKPGLLSKTMEEWPRKQLRHHHGSSHERLCKPWEAGKRRAEWGHSFQLPKAQLLREQVQHRPCP